MHALLEILPVGAMLIGYLSGKVLNADEAMYFLAYGAIIGTLMQFALYRWQKRKMSTMVLATGVILIVFAAITLISHDDLFIKIKPTVLSFAFALFFWGYAVLRKESVLKIMMAEQVELPAHKWMILNWAWIIFNALIGLVNLIIIWQIQQGRLGNDSWVTFKTALLPVSLAFVAGQAVYLFKHGRIINTDEPNPRTVETDAIDTGRHNKS